MVWWIKNICYKFLLWSKHRFWKIPQYKPQSLAGTQLNFDRSREFSLWLCHLWHLIWVNFNDLNITWPQVRTRHQPHHYLIWGWWITLFSVIQTLAFGGLSSLQSLNVRISSWHSLSNLFCQSMSLNLWLLVLHPVQSWPSTTQATLLTRLRELKDTPMARLSHLPNRGWMTRFWLFWCTLW